MAGEADSERESSRVAHWRRHFLTLISSLITNNFFVRDVTVTREDVNNKTKEADRYIR